ncbi:MAG TPA: VWA domain-containing protein [Acidobacteriaceae bacterium]|jgi:VWFA-related protein|nr:VWA domain-containing protein [Acidobacteriaceae bacterium]
MRFPATLVLLCSFAVLGATAQTSPPASPPTLSVRTNLVEVPALVTTKSGQVVFSLTAPDFRLTDNGVPQRLTLIPDTDSQPLALAVVVETGGAGAQHLNDYAHLDAILDTLVGSVPHQVALIAFDAVPHLLVPFEPSIDAVSHQLIFLQPGDSHVALLDAVAFAVRLLRNQPPSYRRAVLLLSETVDRDSLTPLTEALRLISDTNTTIYAFGFSSAGYDVNHEASKFNRGEPGPAKGCFSHDHTGDPTDDEYDGHYSRQVLDCISDLAPPLRFATMAWLASRDALAKKTASTLADLTGGTFYRFRNGKDLNAALLRASNDVPNFYVLSFRPSDPTPGLHALHLDIPARPDLRLHARTAYWIDNP